MHIRVVRFLKFSRGSYSRTPFREGATPPGPTRSMASGAVGAGSRAGRTSRGQPPPYANPGYATDSNEL
jgi:hypothetical protein